MKNKEIITNQAEADASTNNESLINNQTNTTKMQKTNSTNEMNNNVNASLMNVNLQWLRKGSIIDGDGNYVNNNVQVDADNVQTIELYGSVTQVIDEVYGLKTIWALKAFLPFTPEENYAQLRTNIQENGIINPLLYTVTEQGDKLLIDGHTRLSIAIDLGIPEGEVKTQEIPNKFQSIDEIKVWILEHQSQRRVVNTKQRIELALPLRETIAAMAKRNNSIGGSEKEVEEQVHTNARLAQIAGVGVSTITRYLAKNGLSEKRPKKTKEPRKPQQFNTLEEANKALNDGGIAALLIVKTLGQLQSVIATSINLGYIFHEDALVGQANHAQMDEAA